MKLFMNTLCFLIIVCLISSCSGSGIDPMPMDSKEPGWHAGQISHDGLERVYRFYIPEDLPENPSVVVLLHGGTQSMDAIFRANAGGTREWPAVAEDEKFLLVVPNGTHIDDGSPEGDNQIWNDCRMPTVEPVTRSQADDVGFISALVDWTHTQFQINRENVFVTGASNGARMSYSIAMEQPELIKAAAVFIANLSKERECEEAQSPVPMLIMNGTEDPINPYEGGATDGRGEVLSAEETRDYWIAVNGADAGSKEVTELPDRDPSDGSEITCEFYTVTTAGAPVRFCTVEGGGHTIPSIEHTLPRFITRILGPQNQDVEGARLAWEFFSAQ